MLVTEALKLIDLVREVLALPLMLDVAVAVPSTLLELETEFEALQEGDSDHDVLPLADTLSL